MAVSHTVVPIVDITQVGEARRLAQRAAEVAGFGETDCGRAALIVSELATNVLRHGLGGQILFRQEHNADRRLIDILAIDSGPGMNDLSRCLSDGYSTGGTPGNGLGAVRRLSKEFDIHSAPGQGTVVYCRLANDRAPNNQNRFVWSAICCCAPGESVSGDSWRVAQSDSGMAVMIADGLGHGPQAEAAAAKATEVFDEAPFQPLDGMLEKCHTRMLGSRGAAVAVSQIDASAHSIKYAGIGNISGSYGPISGNDWRGMMSHNGTLGVQIRRIQVIDYECQMDFILIMHSDGLQTRWSLKAYPGLLNRHPAVVAAVLYRDFARGRDDATIVVIRLSASGSGSDETT